MWPGGTQMKIADGFTYWPDENSSDDVSNFISAFRKKGYELCDSWNMRMVSRRLHSIPNREPRSVLMRPGN